MEEYRENFLIEKWYDPSTDRLFFVEIYRKVRGDELMRLEPADVKPLSEYLIAEYGAESEGPRISMDVMSGGELHSHLLNGWRYSYEDRMRMVKFLQDQGEDPPVIGGETSSGGRYSMVDIKCYMEKIEEIVSLDVEEDYDSRDYYELFDRHNGTVYQHRKQETTPEHVEKQGLKGGLRVGGGDRKEPISGDSLERKLGERFEDVETTFYVKPTLRRFERGEISVGELEEYERVEPTPEIKEKRCFEVIQPIPDPVGMGQDEGDSLFLEIVAAGVLGTAALVGWAYQKFGRKRN